MSLEESFECSRCGAPLEITPEAIVAICSYCGYPNIIKGIVDPSDIYLVPPASRREVEEAFWRHVEKDFDLRRIKNQLSIADIYGVYVPVWIGKVHLSGSVSYYYYKSEDKGRKRVYKVVKIEEDRLIPFIARRQITTFGARELVEYVSEKHLSSALKLTEITEEEWTRIKLDILNTEYDKKEAVERIREDSLDQLREEFEDKGEIDGFNVTASEPQNVKLYLLPLWQVYYTYKRSTYYAIMAGWDLTILTKTEPMTLIRRALYASGVMGTIVVSPILAYFVFSDKKVEAGEVLFTFLPLIAAYWLSKQIVKDIRVEEARMR